MLGAMNSKKTYIIPFIDLLRLFISIQKYIFYIFNIKLFEPEYTLCPITQNILNENLYLYKNPSNYISDLNETYYKGFKDKNN
jgi:hypothetical protein